MTLYRPSFPWGGDLGRAGPIHKGWSLPYAQCIRPRPGSQFVTAEIRPWPCDCFLKTFRRDPVTTSKIHSAPVTCQAPFELWLAAERHGVCSISSAMWMWWGLVYEGHLHLQSLMRVVFVRAPAWLRQSCRNSAIPAVLLGRKAIQKCAAVEHHNV